jgi:hypothetical protein
LPHLPRAAVGDGERVNRGAQRGVRHELLLLRDTVGVVDGRGVLLLLRDTVGVVVGRVVLPALPHLPRRHKQSWGGGLLD